MTVRRLAIVAGGALLWAAGAVPAAEAVHFRTVTSLHADAQKAALSRPEGVAFLGREVLVVADTGNGRLVRYAVTPEGIVARGESRLAELPYPQHLAPGPRGELWVLDGQLRRIGRVGPDGAFLGYVALPEGVVPRGVCADHDGKAWVLDLAGGRVVVVDGAGKLAREVALPAARGSFYSDIALDGRGNLFVLDSVGQRVLVARGGAARAEPLGGSLEQELEFATSIAVDESGRVFVADEAGGGIVVLGPDGSFRGRHGTEGWKEGSFRQPSALAVSGSAVAVAERGNNRVQLFAVAD
ncbi:MAG: NHL repeat-containing protein [Acidobacteria bacterium]|nr:NHL repeat-containing protein [Acidobacteriota bacterium]